MVSPSSISGPGAPTSAKVMAQSRSENFPVASRFLPRRERSHLLAVYGFARLVDDAGDEAAGDRLALLDWIDDELGKVYRGCPTHPLMRRLVPTVRECRLPAEPFRRLIEANRQDQRVIRYETIDDLLGYCELSANPVGHLVLHILGAATPERMRLSDAVCSGLQLTEHWQDVAEDAARGRIYLPAADMERFGCAESDLSAPPASGPLRALIAFEIGRARALLDAGLPLVRTLRGRPALAVAAFVAGGRAALDAIERGGHEVLGGPPRPSRRHRIRALVATLARARAG